MSEIDNSPNLTNIKEKASNFMKKALDLASNKSKMIQIISWTIVIILIISIFSYISLEIAKKDSYPKMMKQMLEQYKPTISSFSNNDFNFSYNLRDYYVKSSYNSCCAGDFKNDYVSIKALKQVIGQGVRFLDFAIYTLDEKPIIAASSQDSIYYKETYNSIDFDEVIKTISNMAFSNSLTPTANDPLILNFRIYSDHKNTYDNMAETINKYLGNKLLPQKHGKENQGHNIGNLSLSYLSNKVLIFTNKPQNDSFETSELYNIVNACSSTPNLQILNNFDVIYAPNYNEIISFNKKKMTISIPDLSYSPKNIPASIHQKYGIQFICINYQTNDNNLKYYEKFFNDAGYAFVLKPKHLRFIPTKVKVPKKQDPSLSFAPRQYKKDYFQIDI